MNYEPLLDSLKRVNWSKEQVIGLWRQEFSKPFLPEGLAQVEGLSFLGPEEKRAANHVRAYEYVSMCALAEDSLIVHLRREMHHSERYRRLALNLFAGQERKHIELFKHYGEAIEKGLRIKAQFVGPTDGITEYVIEKHCPLAIALMNAQFENFTRTHYENAVLDDHDIDQSFKRLLHYHWIEERQHLKVGKAMIKEMAEKMSRYEITLALAEFASLGKFLETLLEQQAIYNVENFLAATGRTLTFQEREEMTAAMLKGMRWTYIDSAMTPEFLQTLESVQNEHSATWTR